MKVVFLIFTLFFFNTLLGQNGLGSWNIINVTMGINNQWSVFSEGQLRSLSFYNQFHYYEIKSGVNYKLNSNFSFTTGFGSYNTYAPGGNFNTPMQQKEIRTWLQFNNKQSLKYFSIDHRYRAEQRFTTNGYRNRFRYRLGAIIPLNNTKVETKTVYLSLWNELFFTNKEPFFERNRLFVGAGYQINKNTTIQSGYIYQFDYKINDEIGRDFFNIALLYNFDLNQIVPSNNPPSTTD